MKLKTPILGLGLLVLILCALSLSFAARSNEFAIRYMVPPSEHPWQHDGTSGVGDGANYNLIPAGHVPITPCMSVMIAIQTRHWIAGSVRKATIIRDFEANKHSSFGER
jgi:hypothetical protein